MIRSKQTMIERLLDGDDGIYIIKGVYPISVRLSQMLREGSITLIKRKCNFNLLNTLWGKSNR